MGFKLITKSEFAAHRELTGPCTFTEDQKKAISSGQQDSGVNPKCEPMAF